MSSAADHPCAGLPGRSVPAGGDLPCPYCRSQSRVEVHGHVQCGACGINIEPCCSGLDLDPVCEAQLLDGGADPID